MNISFSGTLLRFIGFQKNIDLDADTVNDALRKVAGKYPKALPVLFDGEGKIREIHRIFVNGRQLVSNDFDVALDPGDRLDVLTAIAGG